MTLVNIDITGVASSTGPDDRVVVRAPMVREKSGGGLVSTREEVIPLVNGIGDKELEPGPVMVKFLCEGVSDTGEKMGVVPEEGPVDIFDVLADSLEYPTPVVAAAQRARDEAIRAADTAADDVVQRTAHLRDEASRGAEASAASAASAAADALTARNFQILTASDRDATVDARDRAEAAAWKAELTTVGVNVVEDPAGSGLWIIGADNLVIAESPDNSGLYRIGAG